MRSRLSKVAAALTLIAALAVGGATFASAASKAPPAKAPAPAASSKAPAKAPTKQLAGAADNDTLQEGDQTGPDVPGAPESEPAGESSSEVPGDDGPGGHADEPGNPNADHQFEGVE